MPLQVERQIGAAERQAQRLRLAAGEGRERLCVLAEGDANLLAELSGLKHERQQWQADSQAAK